MRRLTDEERMALVEVGPPGEGPVSEGTFAELVALRLGHLGRRTDLLGLDDEAAGLGRHRRGSGRARVRHDGAQDLRMYTMACASWPPMYALA